MSTRIPLLVYRACAFVLLPLVAGGVNACMADGSVHFFDDDIDLSVWWALATRAGPPPDSRENEEPGVIPE